MGQLLSLKNGGDPEVCKILLAINGNKPGDKGPISNITLESWSRDNSRENDEIIP